MYVCMYVYMYVCMYICMYVYMYVCIRVHRMPMGIFFLPNQLIRATESCLFIWALKVSKSFSEILMSCALTRGLKLLKIGIFYENRQFSVEIFLYSTTSMLCHISLERSANTEKNGI